MSLEIKICCEKCGHEYNFVEIERITNVHRQLTRIPGKTNYLNTCTNCGRKVTASQLSDNYVCKQCKSRIKMDKKKKAKKPKKPKPRRKKVFVPDKDYEPDPKDAENEDMFT
jgi:DNA-directed RNA polymerase subunit RPC12/RpoP|tara:strand:- start:1680 stop:2015 length:336 start_codon:yes stop_codon:yes gene_type:complete